MEMKIIIKKLISVSTAIAVMFNLPFVTGLPVKAADVAVPADVHSAHKVCKNNEEVGHVCNDQCQTEITWEAWGDDDNEKGKLPTTTGNYYLAGDIEVSGEATIPSGNTVSLCLNGHNITMKTENKCIFKVSGTLNLCDCQKKGKLTGVTSTWTNYSGNTGDYVGGSPIYINEKGTFNMYSGIISGNKAKIGGGVCLHNGTKFTMFGGTISNNTAGLQGGGVNADGDYNSYNEEDRIAKKATFIMKGGTITGNKVDGTYKYYDYPKWSHGGGILVCDGTEFIMSGGTISNNSDTSGGGGGVYISYDTRYTCKIENATINNNTAEYGGGVYAGAGGQYTYASVIISGSTITSNNAAYGGGILSGGIVEISDVTITHNNAKFEGNDGRKGNGGGVFIDSRSLEMESSTISYNTATGDGGGVYNTNGELKINNGEKNCEISHNTAKNGGGVYIANRQTFTMNCGTISDNTATENGGGVYNNGTLTIDGKVDITPNKSGGNVYLPNDKTITIGENFKTNSNVGVTTAVAPTSCTANLITISGTSNTDVSTCFTSDNADYRIKYDVGAKDLKLVKHTMQDTYSKDDLNHWKNCQVCDYEEKAPHKWVDDTSNAKVDPDLTNPGTKYLKCSVCEKEKTEEIPVLTDIRAWTIEVIKPPTLTEEGKYSFTNKADTTYIITKDTVPNLKDENTWTKQEEGYTKKPGIKGEDNEGECKFTSEIYGEVTVKVPVLSDADTWTKTVDKAPTLTEKGEYTYTHKDGVYDSVIIEVPNLKDETWTKQEGFTQEPEVNKDGKCEFTSDTYGTIEVTVPKLSDTDTWENEHTDPDEKNDGEDVYTSDIYGSVTIAIPALGHTHEWGKWTLSTKPTINEEGAATRTCTKNETHKDKKDVPALSDENTWEKVGWEDEPTLEEKGTYKFKNSDYGEVTGEIPALSDTTVWTKVDAECIAATVAESGKDVYNSVYGKVEVIIPATGGSQPSESPTNTPTNTPANIPTITPINPPSDTTPAATVPTDETEPAETDFFPNIDLDSVVKEVEQKEDVPTANLTTPVKDLLKAIMSTAELAAIKETDDIKIVLKVEDASETVPTEGKQQVEAFLQEYTNYTLGQYLNITLSTMINSNETKITDTNAPITVAFETPENLRKVNRVFSVIRVHESARTMLNDLDNDPDTVTIETDRFSTYALVYTDKEGNPNTGVYVSIIPFAIAAVSLGALAIKKKSKHN